MRHYVTIRGKTIAGNLYLRGGARIYTRSISDAACFRTIDEAEKAAEQLRRLLHLLPGRTYSVGTLTVKGGAA